MRLSTKKSTVTGIRAARLSRGVDAAEWDARLRAHESHRTRVPLSACDAYGRRGAEPVPREIVDHVAQQGRELSATGRGSGGKLLWAALKRKLDREDPGYLA